MLNKFFILIFLICFSLINTAEKNNIAHYIDQIVIENDLDARAWRLMLITLAGAQELNRKEYIEKIDSDLKQINLDNNVQVFIVKLKQYVIEIVNEINPNNPYDVLNKLMKETEVDFQIM